MFIVLFYGQVEYSYTCKLIDTPRREIRVAAQSHRGLQAYFVRSYLSINATVVILIHFR